VGRFAALRLAPHSLIVMCNKKDSRIVFAIIMLCASFPVDADQGDAPHCPLTSGYLLKQLENMENLSISPENEEITMLKNHTNRMAGEVLKNEQFKNNKECEYFHLSVALTGMGSEDKSFRIYNYNEIQAYVKSCKKWISTKFTNTEKEIESVFCK
jgi:hypothetical protein